MLYQHCATRMLQRPRRLYNSGATVAFFRALLGVVVQCSYSSYSSYSSRSMVEVGDLLRERIAALM